jgi:vesicle-fusing ATPase
MSVIIMDEIELLIDYSSVGPRFSINMLGAFRALLQRDPPKGRKRMIVATTSERSALSQLNLISRFTREIAVPNIADWNEFWGLMMASRLLQEAVAKRIFKGMRDRYGEYVSVGVKYVMMAIVLASRVSEELAVDAFMNHLDGKMVIEGPTADPNQFAFAS